MMSNTPKGLTPAPFSPRKRSVSSPARSMYRSFGEKKTVRFPGALLTSKISMQRVLATRPLQNTVPMTLPATTSHLHAEQQDIVLQATPVRADQRHDLVDGLFDRELPRFHAAGHERVDPFLPTTGVLPEDFQQAVRKEKETVSPADADAKRLEEDIVE